MHQILNGERRNCKQPIAPVVPMVVSEFPALTGAGRHICHHSPLKHNGQRWQALAV
jgi:hypothetical protein